MQILGRPSHRDVEGDQTAARNGHRGHIGAPHGAVGRDDQIAGEALAHPLDQLGKVRASRFLLAFDQHLQIHRQPTRCFEESLRHEDRDQHRSLVVGHAAPVEAIVAHGGLERRRQPFVQRIGRLHVVMAVDEDGRLLGIRHDLAEHRGMATGF
jgi:hypothetical protein